jgi:hypothetical protein
MLTTGGRLAEFEILEFNFDTREMKIKFTVYKNGHSGGVPPNIFVPRITLVPELVKP